MANLKDVLKPTELANSGIPRASAGHLQRVELMLRTLKPNDRSSLQRNMTPDYRVIVAVAKTLASFKRLLFR